MIYLNTAWWVFSKSKGQKVREKSKRVTESDSLTVPVISLIRVSLFGCVIEPETINSDHKIKPLEILSFKHNNAYAFHKK